MNLLRNALRSNASVRAVKPTLGLPLYLRESPRCFSTETELPSPPPQEPQPDASVDRILQSASSGFLFGRLSGGSRYALKSDIIKLLEGSNLTPDDIKFSYNWTFDPIATLVRFSSPSAYNHAQRTIRKFGFYKFERINGSEWDILAPYDGKTVVLQGIPRNALQDDVDRFLSGFDFDASSMQMFNRGSFPNNIRLAIVRFPSQIQAMNAFLKKNRGLCLNDRISVRVLQ
ncbi:hypothetical protein SLA2020_507740 [Shorea laevis]